MKKMLLVDKIGRSLLAATMVLGAVGTHAIGLLGAWTAKSAERLCLRGSLRPLGVGARLRLRRYREKKIAATPQLSTASNPCTARTYLEATEKQSEITGSQVRVAIPTKPY